MWDLSRSEIESRSPALAGGFFIIELPGKPWLQDLIDTKKEVATFPTLIFEMKKMKLLFK